MKNYKLVNNVKLHELDDTLYLIDFNSGITVEVSEIGGYIIKAIINKKTTEEIISLISSRFVSVKQTMIENDVNVFCKKMLEKNLIADIDVDNSNYQEASFLTVTTRGVSMLPIIQDGDKIKLQSDIEYISFGDVVAISYNKRIILHRVVDMDRDRVITKGDNNFLYEIPISKKDIIGVTLNSMEGYNPTVITNRITLNTTYFNDKQKAKSTAEMLDLDINNTISHDRNVIKVLLAPSFNLNKEGLTNLKKWNFFDEQKEVNILLVSCFTDKIETVDVNTIEIADVVIPFFKPLMFYEMDLCSYILCAITSLGLFANASIGLNF